MRSFRTSSIAAAALALSGGGLIVHAGGAPPPAPRTAAHRPAPRRIQVSMVQAVRLAQRRFKARVVRAETQTQGGRTIYVLRMLDGAGRVFAVRVDAATGAIL